MSDISTVVIDNGSGQIKCGMSGTEAPESVFMTIVGHLKPGVVQIPGFFKASPVIGKKALGDM